MTGEDLREARRRVWRAWPSMREGVPPAGAVVRDAALALRPGRVVDWDGGETLTLEPPGGGAAWTTTLVEVRWDRVGSGAVSWAAGVFEQLDRAPLELAVLAAALRATCQIVREERSLGGGRCLDISTATDVLRDRHLHGTALVGLVRFGHAERLQIARAVCTVVYGRIPAGDPVAALLRWQSGVVHDPAALARVCENAAERLEAVAAIVRAEATLALLDGGNDSARAPIAQSSTDAGPIG